MASLFRRRDVLRSITAVSEPSAPMFALPKVGDELFGYRLQSQLGQGAFARVFLAEQSELAGRLVALKTSDLTGSEPQTLAQLQHTHIVPIYSVHEDTASGILTGAQRRDASVSALRANRQLTATTPNLAAAAHSDGAGAGTR